jgi:hypothetical protein
MKEFQLNLFFLLFTFINATADYNYMLMNEAL